MTGSDHISDDLYKWRNLYHWYSQQGLEAMNSLVKMFFFRQTNHRGNVRGGSKISQPVDSDCTMAAATACVLMRATESSICKFIDTHTPH